MVYGSSLDAGGVQVFKSEDVQMKEIMAKIIFELNLQGHCTKRGDWIDGPANVEGHLCSDKRRYAVHLARLMPPEDHRLSQ